VRLPVAARALGPVPAEPLVHWLLDQPESRWDADRYRQQAFSVHRHTRTLRAVWTEPAGFPHASTQVHPLWAQVEPLVSPVLAAIAARLPHPCRLANAMFARLDPGGHISMHSDGGAFFATCHRVHVPLRTQPQVMFVVGGERVQMAVGEAWEIDNTRLHGVTNAGSEPRVHLIVDLCPDPAADPA